MKRKSIFRGMAILGTALVLAFNSMGWAKRMSRTTDEMTLTVTLHGARKIPSLRASNFLVTDNGQVQDVDVSAGPEQQVPLHLALVIEEGIANNFNNELPNLRNFVLRLPKGAEVMVATIDRNHSNVITPFTTDLSQAARSIPVVRNFSSEVPLNAFVSLSEIVGKFDALSGRKDIVFIGPGYDILQDELSPSFNTDLKQAESNARSADVVVHTIWVPAQGLFTNHMDLLGASNLLDLSDTTGGLSFWNVDRKVVTDLSTRLDSIQEAFNQQYILRFSPDVPSNAGHHIKVTLKDVPGAKSIKVSYPAR